MERKQIKWLILFLMIITSLTIDAKSHVIVKKISVTPSTAKIYIDGNYVGEGVTQVTMQKAEA